MYPIRKIKCNEVDEALALALEVFMQFEAPDYAPEGVTTFKRDIVENEEFINNCRQGICPVYAAFDGDKIVCCAINSALSGSYKPNTEPSVQA